MNTCSISATQRSAFPDQYPVIVHLSMMKNREDSERTKVVNRSLPTFQNDKNAMAITRTYVSGRRAAESFVGKDAGVHSGDIGVVPAIKWRDVNSKRYKPESRRTA